MQERQTDSAAKDRVIMESNNAYKTLEAMRMFAPDPAEREATARTYLFEKDGKKYAVATTGTAILSIPIQLIDKTVTDGIKELPSNLCRSFLHLFSYSSVGARSVHEKLKSMRAWCGKPRYRTCQHCDQESIPKTRPGNLLNRAIDRNLIAIATAFGDEDKDVSVHAEPHRFSPAVFTHEHFSAVVMPMREELDDLPKFPSLTMT